MFGQGPIPSCDLEGNSVRCLFENCRLSGGSPYRNQVFEQALAVREFAADGFVLEPIGGLLLKGIEMAKTDMEKLEIVLKHWIEHNEEHREEFQKWAERAKAAGSIAVYEDISSAVERMGKANEYLQRALEELSKS